MPETLGPRVLHPRNPETVAGSRSNRRPWIRGKRFVLARDLHLVSPCRRRWHIPRHSLKSGPAGSAPVPPEGERMLKRYRPL